jgi:hypothetical protein
MKKPRKNRKLTLNRETLVHLDHPERTQLNRVLGGSAPQQCTASTCNRPCTCPV